MQLYGAQKALHSLEQITDRKKLETFYLYHSLLGEIYAQLNNTTEAKQQFEEALSLTQSNMEKKILRDKILALLNW